MTGGHVDPTSLIRTFDFKVALDEFKSEALLLSTPQIP
jgi:hypothetical protein